MRIAGLKNLNIFPVLNITDSISTHSKFMILNEAKSLAYNIGVLFDRLKVQKQRVNQEVLFKCSFVEIGSSPEEGIRLIGNNNNFIITVPEPGNLKLTFLNKTNGDAEKIVTIRNNSFFVQSKKILDENFEDNFEEVLNYIEEKIINLKSKILVKSVKPYIPNKAEQKNLDEINKQLRVYKIRPTTTDFVSLNDFEMDFVKSIIAKYQSIKDLYNKFNNPVTKSNVRKYYKNYDSTKSNANTMFFKEIGPESEDIGIGIITHKSKNFLFINVVPKNETSYAFVISENGSVQKNLPYETVRTPSSKKRHDSFPDFYTEFELKRLNIQKFLECANDELKNFENHTINIQKRQEDFLAYHNNDNIGSLSNQMPKIEKIFSSIEDLKTNIRTRFKYLADSYSLLKDNGINIEFSRRGILFKNFTPENYDLKIIFPKLLNQQAVQIVLLDKDSIVKSFYIIDEKLLKFDIKSLVTAFTHPTRQRYYHSQEYIDNSGLNGYIDSIIKTLRNAISVTKSE